MTRGRKKLPQEALNLRGTARKDRPRPTVGPGEPLAEIRMWSVPGYALLSDRARQIYRRQARQANNLKILTEADLLALVLYAREYDMALKAMEKEDEVGVMYSTMDKFGQIIWHSNPARMVVDSTIRNLNKIGSNFGFTPVDRQRLKAQSFDPKEKGFKAIFAAIVSNEPESPDEQ